MGAEFVYRNSEDEGEEYCSTFFDFKKDRGDSEHMDELWNVIRPTCRPRPLNLTVRGSNGDVTEMITIIG